MLLALILILGWVPGSSNGENLLDKVILFQEPISEGSAAAEGGEAEPEVVPVETRSPEELMAAAKEAFRARDFETCVQTLKTLVDVKDPPAMILSSDALYAKGSPEDLVKAQELYFRVIYELDEAPHRDHCYVRIAQIYMEQNNPFEAKLYFRQATKKFPDSPYMPEANLALFEIAERERNYRELKKWAQRIEGLPGFEDEKERVRYVSTIEAKRKVWDGEELENLYQANRLRVIRFPDLLARYAERMEQAGNGMAAKQVYLDLVNFHPEHSRKGAALLALGDFEKANGKIESAVFLYRSIMEDMPGTFHAARTMIRMADLFAQGDVLEFEMNGKQWGYSDFLTAIRFSRLEPSERAPFVYRQALLQAVSDPPDKALLTLRQLTHEYPEGPFAVLYRDSYRELLHHAILNFYRLKRYWDLDQLYQKHHYFLEHSTETQYPHMMAKAYLEMGLTAPARDVFEALWREKESIKGFELAFEEPFVDYFMLLNDLRLDDFLESRLPEYETYYGNEGRFYDRFLVAQTGYEHRQLDPLEVVARAKTRPLFKASEEDAQRLQYLTLAAQAAQDWAYADQLFKEVLGWPELTTMRPFLVRAAKIFDADYQFRIGNYFAARRKYLTLRIDQALLPEERVWADLQLARLYEMNEQPTKSMELYAQIALNLVPGTEGYALFAKRRMEALAFDSQYHKSRRGAKLGTN